MNYNQVEEQYNQTIANYVCSRIEEDYGANGVDGFLEKDNDIFDDKLIKEYIQDYNE